MKIKLLACIAFLSLMSCSGGDDNSSVAEKDLDTITGYYNGTSPTYTMEFQDNKPSRNTMFNPEGTITFDYEYNPDGQFSSYTGTNNTGQVIYHDTAEYDNSGRLIGTTSMSVNVWGDVSNTSVEYVYNNDNTVTALQSNGNAITQTSIFYFNDNGLLYKIDNDGVVYEVTYEGAVITSYITESYTRTFTYDMETPVKGEFLSFYRNMFASYTNYALYFGIDQIEADRYLISQSDSNGNEVNYELEFDSDGYPVKRTTYAEGGSEVKILITYQ